jgi:hypothetical protein
MPDKEASAKILPKSRKDRKTLWGIGSFLALMVVFVVTVLFFQHRRQEEMENSWESATATIEDVRPVIALQGGRGMLYQPEVLARYRANGSEQRQWIKVERLPESLESVRFQAFRWKGKQCVVRWKASEPNLVVVELN